jgi:hypothetical protein
MASFAQKMPTDLGISIDAGRSIFISIDSNSNQVLIGEYVASGSRIHLMFNRFNYKAGFSDSISIVLQVKDNSNIISIFNLSKISEEKERKGVDSNYHSHDLELVAIDSSFSGENVLAVLSDNKSMDTKLIFISPDGYLEIPYFDKYLKGKTIYLTESFLDPVNIKKNESEVDVPLEKFLSSLKKG